MKIYLHVLSSHSKLTDLRRKLWFLRILFGAKKVIQVVEHLTSMCEPGVQNSTPHASISALLVITLMAQEQ